MWHRACEEVRGQLTVVGSLLPVGPRDPAQVNWLASKASTH